MSEWQKARDEYEDRQEIMEAMGSEWVAKPSADALRDAGDELSAEMVALKERYTHRWTQAVEGVETEFSVALVPKPELDRAEAELARIRKP